MNADKPPLTLPRHGCSQRQRPEWLQDDESWIALVERGGGCSFLDKVRWMQKSGAIAVIVGNNDPSQRLLTMYASDDTSDVTVPSTFIQAFSYTHLRFVIGVAGRDQEGSKDYVHLIAKILPSSEFDWPLVDVIVITVVIPLLIVSLVYSMWRYRTQRRHFENAMAAAVAEENTRLLGLLTQEDLMQLPLKTFDPAHVTPPECESCAICLDDFEAGEEVRLLRCKHTFHCKCVDTWLTSRRRFCPICKADSHPNPEESVIIFDDDEYDDNRPLVDMLPQRDSSLESASDAYNNSGDIQIPIDGDQPDLPNPAGTSWMAWRWPLWLRRNQ